MTKWLLKTEPSDYSFADLERDGGTVWDGVGNNWALKNMRAMRVGDLALIYHTGSERKIIGEARVTSDPYPDPRSDDERLIVIDIAPVRRWESPVDLGTIKADRAFSDFPLVRFSRLSVMPVKGNEWKRLERLGRKQ